MSCMKYNSGWISQTSMGSKIDQLLQVVVANKMITEAVKLDILDMKPRVWGLHLSAILDLLSPGASPENLLQRHTSLARRRNGLSAEHLKSFPSLIQSLNEMGCRYLFFTFHSSIWTACKL